MKTILALNLGKFKAVSSLLTADHASIPVFKTIMNHLKTFEQFLLDVKPSLLVLEACGLSGWVVDLARKLGFDVLVAHARVRVHQPDRVFLSAGPACG